MNVKSYLVSLLAASLAVSVHASETLRARAIITASERATLSGELTANVTKLPVKMGSSFAAGDPLIYLDCQLYAAQLSRVEADTALASAKLENANKLKALNSIGEFDVEIAKAEFAKAQADLKLAQLNIERCVIRAPFDGRVVDVLIKQFEKAEQQPLIEVVGTAALQAEIVVPAAWTLWLSEGVALNLIIDETGESVAAEVSQLNPTVDTVSQTLKLIAEVESSPSILAGFSATAEFAQPIR